jgi:hypothetical protein
MRQSDEINNDRQYWEVLAEYLGWRLSGYTYKQSAIFFDADNHPATLTGSQRDDIVRVINQVYDQAFKGGK